MHTIPDPVPAPGPADFSAEFSASVPEPSAGRRRFLRMAGALPVVAALPARALTLVDDPDDGRTFRAIVFHDIRADVKASFAVDPEDAAVNSASLAEFFEWLRYSGHHPVGVQQLLDAREGRTPLPARALLLTFDDGYASFYQKVYLLLRMYRYPAVLALVTRWMETPAGGQVPYGDRLRPRADFVSWAEAREMVQSGLVEIASHSHDLHHGQQANPQGNQLPAGVSLAWDPATRRYETVAAYRQRVERDLATSSQIIARQVGQRPRMVVWPYGSYNAHTQEAARRVRLPVMATLRDGPNRVDAPLDAIGRAYASYSTTMADYAALLRQPDSDAGTRPAQRVLHVDLDYVYDPDPAQQERNLSALLDRIKAAGPRTVFLQAYADADGDGVADALYFPNRHLPMRADLFSRAAWQIRTRAQADVYAWMPVLAFRLPAGHPLAGRVVRADARVHAEAVHRGGAAHQDRYARLSPFDADVRRLIIDLYDDLGSHAAFAGVLFHDDATLADDEDASPAALDTYASWGLPRDIPAIRRDPVLAARWAAGKTEALTRFTLELAARLRQWQPRLRTARNLYARTVLEPAARDWMAQDYREALRSYDYTAVMAMPFMEGATDPDRWLAELAHRALAEPDAAQRVLFELQTRDWRTRQPVPDDVLVAQTALLRRSGIRHIGWYPDDFPANQPSLAALRAGLSVATEATGLALPRAAAAPATAGRPPFTGLQGAAS